MNGQHRNFDIFFTDKAKAFGPNLSIKPISIFFHKLLEKLIVLFTKKFLYRSSKYHLFKKKL